MQYANDDKALNQQMSNINEESIDNADVFAENSGELQRNNTEQPEKNIVQETNEISNNCSDLPQNEKTDVISPPIQKKSTIFKKSFARNITKIAVLTALAFVLYYFAKFPLPFMFPGFLDMQFSDVPALLAGFSMGPVAGGVVIVIKCLIKMPMSSSFCIGELCDIILGLSFVVPASVYYVRNKNRKGAFIGLIIGCICCCVVSIFANWLVIVPLYINLYGEQAVLGLMSSLFPKVTADNLFAYYLPLSVLPFNILRCIVVSIFTFILYKRLSKALHW